MATAMEAIMGAVFLDGGAEALDRVMARLGLTHPLLHLVKSTSLHPFQTPNLNVYYDALTLNSIGPFRECPKLPFCKGSGGFLRIPCRHTAVALCG